MKDCGKRDGIDNMFQRKTITCPVAVTAMSRSPSRRGDKGTETSHPFDRRLQLDTRREQAIGAQTALQVENVLGICPAFRRLPLPQSPARPDVEGIKPAVHRCGKGHAARDDG